MPYGAVIKSENSLESQSTPDVHDVPELDWDDTPHPQDHSPRTPSPFNSPSRAPAADNEKESESTPRRRVKASRASLMFEAYGVSSLTQSERKIYYASESGYIDLKPAPLFHNTYPAVMNGKREESAIIYDTQNHYKSKDFTFSQWARYSDQSSTTSAPRFYMPCEERGPLEKRTKKESSVLEQSVRYDTVTLVTPPVSINAKDAYPRVNIGRNSSVTTTRFSRILPFDAIERLIKQPNRCVASLVTRPDERCWCASRSSINVKTRLLTQLVELDDPTDFIGAMDYLKHFIDAMTCNEYHHRIAIEQLERLHDRKCGIRRRVPHGKHDFTWTDLDALESWLQAWTTLPEGAGFRSVQQAEKLNASAPIGYALGSSGIARDPASEKLLQFPAPSPAFLKALQIVNTSKSTREQHVSEAKDLVQTIVTVNQLDQKPNVLAAKLAEVKITVQEINVSEAEENNDNIEKDNSDHYMEKTEKQAVAEIIIPDDQDLEESKTNIVTQLTDISRTTEPEEDVQNSQATMRVRVDNKNQPMHTTWKFDASQVYDFKFITAVAQEPTPKESPRIQPRPRRPQVNLHQNFCWYHQDIDTSVQDAIYDRLSKDLLPHEFEEGLIYMYWITGSFGFVKIGKTSGISTENRLNAWRRQCRYEIEEHTRGEQELAVQLPHAYRVEALVHEELREARLREEGCKRCGVWHKEWFLTSPEHAQLVIKKWSDFMLSKPYDRYGRLKKSITAEKILELCEPVARPTFVKHSRHSKKLSGRDDRQI